MPTFVQPRPFYIWCDYSKEKTVGQLKESSKVVLFLSPVAFTLVCLLKQEICYVICSCHIICMHKLWSVICRCTTYYVQQGSSQVGKRGGAFLRQNLFDVVRKTTNKTPILFNFFLARPCIFMTLKS